MPKTLVTPFAFAKPAAIALASDVGRSEIARGKVKAQYHRWLGNRDPRQLGAADVKAFLERLAVHGKVASGTQNQALATYDAAVRSAASTRSLRNGARRNRTPAAS